MIGRPVLTATTTTMKLEDLTPSEVRDAAARGVPLLLPVGVLEWHGWCAATTFLHSFHSFSPQCQWHGAARAARPWGPGGGSGPEGGD